MYAEESELIEALLAGEPNASSEFGFARHEADDCFQTSLERLVEDDFRRLRLSRREGPLPAYFAQTVRNVARNFPARRQQVDLPGDDCDEEGLHADPPDPAAVPRREKGVRTYQSA